MNKTLTDFCPDCANYKNQQCSLKKSCSYHSRWSNEPTGFKPKATDVINQPTHYHKGGIDVIGFGEQKFPKDELKGFYRMNVLKYVTRYDLKNGVQDLEKAQFYLNKLIELEGEQT